MNTGARLEAIGARARGELAAARAAYERAADERAASDRRRDRTGATPRAAAEPETLPRVMRAIEL